MREPAYIRLHREGRLQARARQAAELLKDCCLCPRRCGVNRRSGETGVCRTGAKAGIAACHAHFGEEAPLVGRSGSGTIFFSSCSLLCSFCQNFEISHRGEGEETDPSRLAAIMVRLMRQGCHNVNFVTPTHVVPQILQALCLAVERGLNIPLVYNCGGYEAVEILKLLDGVIDIYMPDFKFWDNARAERFCRIRDYRERAMAAVREMHRQVGDLVLDESGIAVRGLLVRHLVMPNGAAGTELVMLFLAESISANTYVNVMDQYRPCGHAPGDPLINRRITAEEYAEAIRSARRAGLRRLDNPPCSAMALTPVFCKGNRKNRDRNRDS